MIAQGGDDLVDDLLKFSFVDEAGPKAFGQQALDDRTFQHPLVDALDGRQRLDRMFRCGRPRCSPAGALPLGLPLGLTLLRQALTQQEHESVVR